MGSVRTLGLYPARTLTDFKPPEDVYALHGKEVEITCGFDETRTGLVTGVCFRHLTVRLHTRPHEEVIVPGSMLRVIKFDSEEKDSPNTPYAAYNNSGEEQNSITSKTRIPLQTEGSTSVDCQNFTGQGIQPVITNVDVIHFTGWHTYHVIFSIQATEEDVLMIKQAIDMIVQGQLHRHANYDSRAKRLGEVTKYNDPANMVGFSLPDIHDTWFVDVMWSLPLVEAVVF